MYGALITYLYCQAMKKVKEALWFWESRDNYDPVQPKRKKDKFKKVVEFKRSPFLIRRIMFCNKTYYIKRKRRS